jgi:hypothetical protein
MTLMLLIFYFAHRSFSEENYKLSIYAGLLLLLLATVHLFDVITVAVVLAGWFFYLCITKKHWLWKPFLQITIIGLITLPGIAYYYWVFFMNSAYKAWNTLNQTTTPGLLAIISGFGLIFFFALFFIWHKRKEYFKKNQAYSFLIVWVIINFLLIYLPINVQRRFLLGLHIPLSILAAIALTDIIIPYFHKIYSLQRMVIATLLILFCSATTIYLLALQIHQLHQEPDDLYANTKYLTKQEYAALLWLDENTANDEVIISPYYLSNYIPAISGNKVYCGHWAQTIDFDNKCAQVTAFYEGDYEFTEDYYYFNKKISSWEKILR